MPILKKTINTSQCFFFFSLLKTLEEGPNWARDFKNLIYQEQDRGWVDVTKHAHFFRHKIMTQAYRQLPVSLLEQFVEAYNKDFEYFGYEKRPKDIFDDL